MAQRRVARFLNSFAFVAVTVSCVLLFNASSLDEKASERILELPGHSLVPDRHISEPRNLLQQADTKTREDEISPLRPPVVEDSAPSKHKQTGEVPTSFPWKPVKVKEVDCTRLFAGDIAAIDRAWEIQNSLPNRSCPSDCVINLARNCAGLIEDQGFIMSSLTEEEENFPIAYSILVYQKPAQVLDLLKAIYRPQNVYCIHVDTESEAMFREAMKVIAACFPNVFLTSRTVHVKWGRYSVLEPELICMEELWKYRWKYFINLTGQEFPLKTNYELVKILTAFNGANNVDGSLKDNHTERWEKHLPAPHGLRLLKGSVHVVVSRDFVDFLLHSPVSRDFLIWLNKTWIPDETLFSSLNHNPQLGIKGSFTGEDPESYPKSKPFLARFKNWDWYGIPCYHGKIIRQICILSLGDLPLLGKLPHLFANKFYRHYSRFALECLAERLYNNTRDEYLGKRHFDVSFYENLPYLKNVVTESTWRKMGEIEMPQEVFVLSQS